MSNSVSKTAHARQLAGIRMRAEHAAACVISGRTLQPDDGDRPY